MKKTTKKPKKQEVLKEKATVEADGIVAVYDSAGVLIRRFTREEHGDNYRKIAKGFAGKVSGHLV